MQRIMDINEKGFHVLTSYHIGEDTEQVSETILRWARSHGIWTPSLKDIGEVCWFDLADPEAYEWMEMHCRSNGISALAHIPSKKSYEAYKANGKEPLRCSAVFAIKNGANGKHILFPYSMYYEKGGYPGVYVESLVKEQFKLGDRIEDAEDASGYNQSHSDGLQATSTGTTTKNEEGTNMVKKKIEKRYDLPFKLDRALAMVCKDDDEKARNDLYEFAHGAVAELVRAKGAARHITISELACLLMLRKENKVEIAWDEFLGQLRQDGHGIREKFKLVLLKRAHRAGARVAVARGEIRELLSSSSQGTPFKKPRAMEEWVRDFVKDESEADMLLFTLEQFRKVPENMKERARLLRMRAYNRAKDTHQVPIKWKIESSALLGDAFEAGAPVEFPDWIHNIGGQQTDLHRDAVTTTPNSEQVLDEVNLQPPAKNPEITQVPDEQSVRKLEERVARLDWAKKQAQERMRLEDLAKREAAASETIQAMEQWFRDNGMGIPE